MNDEERNEWRRLRAERLAQHPMRLRATISGLRYIADVDQPAHSQGGFHDRAIHTARSALAQIKKLRNRHKKAASRASALEAAIRQTIEENSHLADGDDCTLLALKRAMGDGTTDRQTEKGTGK